LQHINRQVSKDNWNDHCYHEQICSKNDQIRCHGFIRFTIILPANYWENQVIVEYQQRHQEYWGYFLSNSFNIAEQLEYFQNYSDNNTVDDWEDNHFDLRILTRINNTNSQRVNHSHVEGSESIWSRHLGVINQEDVEKVMKIQDLSDFIKELETVKVFLANLGLLIVWRLFFFFYMFCWILINNRTIRVLKYRKLLA